MDEISSKLELLQLQEKKSYLMQKDVEIDEKLLKSKQQLDELMCEKKELDKEDDKITLQINKIAEQFRKHHRYISTILSSQIFFFTLIFTTIVISL